MNKKLIIVSFCFLMIFFDSLFAQVVVDVNMNTKHSVGNISTFDRAKFINLHSDVADGEWDGDNEVSNLRDDFLEQNDVHMGRTTGGITWILKNSVKEDPSRPGFCSESSVKSLGTNSRNSYASKSSVYSKYEKNSDIVLCTQFKPFWPDGTKTNKGWSLSTTDTQEEPFGTATGEYDAFYLKYFFGQGGSTGTKKPRLFEVINEPYWGYGYDNKNLSMDKLAEFHNSVAKQVKKYNPEVKVGGYTIAFPDVEKNSFAEWETREKKFFDLTKDNIDFWALHLYDFPCIGGKQKYRKGSQMEAMFDFLEQYSFIKTGKVMPFEISEYGAQMHDLNKVWSPYRDWMHMKSVNAMRMQFMDRPNLIEKAIDFLIVKAQWGYNSNTGVVYSHRLLRKKDEPNSYTGKWVYTDMVKNYKLWSDVKGTRVDVCSSDVDVQVDSYVDGKNLYVIMNSLDLSKSIVVKPVLAGNIEKPLSVNRKKVFLSDKNVIYVDEDLSEIPETFTIEPEATLILKYTYANDIIIDNNSREVKYYAKEFLQPLDGGVLTFNINDVVKSKKGEAVLRLGIYRPKGLEVYPNIKFNNEILTVENNYMGDDQKDRDAFFGVYEIKVPYSELKTNNVIKVAFTSLGGYVSSASMRIFGFDKDVSRNGKITSGVKNNVYKKVDAFFNKKNKNIYLDIEKKDDIKGIELYTIDGKILLKEDKISEKMINLSYLEKGIYILLVKTSNDKIEKKIIID